MSEMKPAAWMNGRYLSFHPPINGSPLYTAEQLAEAVAAERERCVKACEGERLEDVASDPTDISYAVAVECCIHAVRSATK